MITVTSRIKTMFGGDLLRYIAAICDNRRIESNAKKMITLGNLLFTNGIDFEILGGATNRLALQIDGYAVKFAMDEQGYIDNLIEYSLSPELQPYVTKTYETNGYVLVAECVEVINTNEKWELHRYDIRKILDTLCQDYLLGDVGYIKKNMTNWGLRDNKPVILDYAYCHRATENLFTCSKCGSVLTYDSSYDILMCSDRSGCKARYTYNERKRIQGKQVDIDMIKERKADSIRLPKDVVSKDIEVFEDRLVGDNVYIIDTPGDMHRYLRMKEAMEMRLEVNSEEGGNDMSKFDALIDLFRSHGTDKTAKDIVFQNLDEETIPEPVYTENYEENYRYASGPGFPIPPHLVTGAGYADDEEDENDENDDVDDTDDDGETGLESFMDRIRKRRAAEQAAFEQAARAQEDAYFESVRKREEEQAKNVSIQQQEDTVSSTVKAEEPETYYVDPSSARKAVIVGNTEEESVEPEPDDTSSEELVEETTEEPTEEDTSESESEEVPITEQVVEESAEEPELEAEEELEDESHLPPEHTRYVHHEKNLGGEQAPSIFVNGKPLAIGESVYFSNEEEED